MAAARHCPVAQCRWHIRFIGENTQSGARQPPRNKQLDESVLINDAAPRHIDDISVRSESFQHRPAYKVFGAWTADGRNHQHVVAFSQLDRRTDVTERCAGYFTATVIRDGAIKADEPLRDGQSDSAKADNADS